MQNLQNLAKFYADPDWIIVENILKEAVRTVRFQPDSSTSPTDFKAQTLANQRLYDAVSSFLSQAQVFTQPEAEGNIFD